MNAEPAKQNRQVNNLEAKILKFTFGSEVGNFLIEKIRVVSEAKVGTISDTEIKMWGYDEKKPVSLFLLGVFIREAAYIWQRHTARHWKGKDEGDSDYHYTQLTSLNLNSDEHSKAVWDWFCVSYGIANNLVGPDTHQLKSGALWAGLLHALGCRSNSISAYYPVEGYLPRLVKKYYAPVIEEIRNPSLLRKIPIGDDSNFIEYIGGVNELEADALRFTFGSEVGGFLIDKIDIKLHPNVVGGRVENSDNLTEILLNSNYNPERLKWLSTFIHEATHIWQRNTGRHQDGVGGEDYEYDKDQLESVEELKIEEHAEAVQDWFTALWGSRYNLIGGGYNQQNADFVWGNTLGILGYDKGQIQRMSLIQKLSKIQKAYSGVLDEIRDISHFPPRLLQNFPNPAA